MNIIIKIKKYLLGLLNKKHDETTLILLATWSRLAWGNLTVDFKLGNDKLFIDEILETFKCKNLKQVLTKPNLIDIDGFAYGEGNKNLSILDFLAIKEKENSVFDGTLGHVINDIYCKMVYKTMEERKELFKKAFKIVINHGRR